MQELIDALPDAEDITEENFEDVADQLAEIDTARETLTDEENGEITYTKYDAAVAKMMELMGQAGAEEAATMAFDFSSTGRGDAALKTICLNPTALRPTSTWSTTDNLVYFGSYGGNPVAYRVLASPNTQSTTPDCLLLDCNTILLTKQFDADGIKNTGQAENPNEWPGSDLETWLKGNEFYGSSSVFSNIEKAAIEETAFEGISHYTTGTDNLQFTDYSAQNHVFCLSAVEAQKLYADDNIRKKIGDNAAWWLRSTRYGSLDMAGFVKDNGRVSSDNVNNSSVGVSPALNVDVSKILFASPATDIKTSEAVDSDLTSLVPLDNEWKLTLKDDDRSSFNASIDGGTDVTAGDTVSITYSGAETGENEYVSVMLADANDNIHGYGRIANNSASGTGTVTIPTGLDAGTYTLKVYSEQCNGDKKTDYASNFKDIPINVSEAANPSAENEAAVNAAKSLIESHNWTVAQGTANTSYDVIVWIEQQLGDMNLNGVTYTVSRVGDFTEATAGTAEDRDGTNGSFAFKVDLCKGSAVVYIPRVNGTITATTYSDPSVQTLAAPTGLAWDSTIPGKAKWDSVAKASGYTVTLYKDGTPGKTASTSSTEYDFTSDITEAGSYTFKAKATGAGYTDSVEAGSSRQTFYSVSFDTKGAEAIAPQIVVSGGTASEPAAPGKEDYAFGGWYNSETNNKWTFASDTVSANTTLYAKWVSTSTDAGVTAVSVAGTAGQIDGTTITVVLPAGSTIPTDASAVSVTTAAGTTHTTPVSGDNGSTWTFAVIAKDGVTQENYTVNVSVATDPDSGASDNSGDSSSSSGSSRRRSGRSGSSTTVTKTATPAESIAQSNSPFTDVSEADWYYPDVAFVHACGLLGGTGDSSFAPYASVNRLSLAELFYRMEGSPITREQFALAFYNYAKYKGYDVSQPGTLDIYTDDTAVSAWLRDAVTWAVGTGIISGRTDQIFAPQSETMNAEFAVILHRFIEKYRLVPVFSPAGDGKILWIKLPDAA